MSPPSSCGAFLYISISAIQAGVLNGAGEGKSIENEPEKREKLFMIPKAKTIMLRNTAIRVLPSVFAGRGLDVPK
jgi:hypothetical protein